MRRLLLIALALLLLAGASSPALAQRGFILPPSSLILAQDKPTEEPPKDQPPVEEPTKPAPPQGGQEPEKTPTPAFEPTKTPTPLFAPTKTPSFGPTPQSGAQAAATPLSVQTETVEPTVATMERPQPTPTPTATFVLVQVIGVVFDDADGDGQRDEDESGVVGVPVVVEDGTGQHTLITDAGGTYTAQVPPSAVVKVVPPAGWRAPGLAALPAPQAGDFPLRRMEGLATGSTTASSAVPLAPVTITQSALDLTGIAIGFAALGVLVWLGLLAHQRATTRSFQQWALADLRLRHEAERESRQFTVSSDDEALAVLEEAALDATGARPFITHLVRQRTTVSPVAVIVAFSAGDPAERPAGREASTGASSARHWVFSPASPDQLKRLEREQLGVLFGKDGRRGIKAHHAVNALNSSPFVTDNLAAVLRYLTADAASPLPRAEQWQVYVVEQRKNR
ncbi:MAG TPA: hypothetical protein VJ793_23570 [Anaerolineae bacterium]|nr:hypothetical protein [Anaerolineae bacterium]